jgi:hypothetical protein
LNNKKQEANPPEGLRKQKTKSDSRSIKVLGSTMAAKTLTTRLLNYWLKGFPFFSGVSFPPFLISSRCTGRFFSQSSSFTQIVLSVVWFANGGKS